tara:strand:+ start:26 stop:625 length:600 start_codon:yes stop_codon:yes gene_type:complete
MTTKTTKKTTTKRKTLTVKPTTIDLPNQPFVFEVFDLVSKQRSKTKKIEVLRKYDEQHLRRVLIWNFDESIQSSVPAGEVPYADPEDQVSYSGTLTTRLKEEVRSMHTKGNFSLGISDKQGHTTIRRESKHFYQFVKGGNDTLNGIRRESMFINILQGLHPLEAEIICLVKDGNLSDKYKITREIVSEAYPDIIWRDGK